MSCTLREIEKAAILEALANNKSVRQAATQLGISFATLYRKIKIYGLKREGTWQQSQQ